MSSTNVKISPAKGRRFRASRASTTVASNRNVSVSVSAQPAIARRRPRPTGARRLATTRSTRADYESTLVAPFVYPGLRLGMGSMVPTVLRKAHRQVTYTPAAGSTAGLIILGPTVYGANAATCPNPGFLTVGEGASSATALSSLSQYQFSAANSTGISNTSQTARVVSAGLRVSFVSNGTSRAGSVNGIQINDSWANMLVQSPDLISGLGSITSVPPKSASLSEVEIQFRPVDNYSFEFVGSPVFGSATSAYINNTLKYLTVSFSGWPAGAFTIIIDTVMHLECIAGVDNDDGDESMVTSSDPGLSNDDVRAVALSTRGTSVFPSWIESRNEAFSYFPGPMGRMRTR